MRDWQDKEPPLAGTVEFLQYAKAAAHDGVDRSTQHVAPLPGFCDEANSRYASNPINLIVYLSVLFFH
jgi:hypothetical protein